MNFVPRGAGLVFLFAALGAPTPPAHGETLADAAVVEGVRMPAWLEHQDGTRVALAAGMVASSDDLIQTGADARVLVRMPEGSAVRLGENARLRFKFLGRSEEAGSSVLKAALDVLKGAFRFTTSLADRFRNRRQIDVRFATVTAGIRGTDIWGRTTPERELVCLLEGNVTVEKPGSQTVTLSDPLTFYVDDHAAPAPVVAALKPEQMVIWAKETDLAPASGAQQVGGTWRVVAASGPDMSSALSIYVSLREAGFAAELYPSGRPGKRIYEVRISGLVTEADAQVLAARLPFIEGVTPQIAH